MFHRLTSAAHGATNLAKPTSAVVNENIVWTIARGGGEISPAIRAYFQYDMEANVNFQTAATPKAKSATAESLVLTAKDESDSNVTVTCPTMMVGPANFTLQGDPYEQGQNFAYKGTSQNPITVGS